MRILLLGEYSNVHNTLAEGLRKFGHEVCVASDGDDWKNYNRDIDLKRKSTGKFYSFFYYIKLKRIFHKLRNYDIVQIINPIFLELSAKRIKTFYDYLRKYNKKVFLGAFGMDYYWVKTCLDCNTFRYSDFNIGLKPRTEETYNKLLINEWLYGEKGTLNQYIAKDCDGIICGLYEYYQCYNQIYLEKCTFIPFPIKLEETAQKKVKKSTDKIIFFIGIQKTRNEYKGTDIMFRALKRIKEEFPDKCEIIKVESVPFNEYKKLMNESDVLLDQLYSYTPGMNGLLAMSKGIVLVGGGEEEHYKLLKEEKLRPIINVFPSENDVYIKLKNIIMNPSTLKKLSEESVCYITKHHNYIKVAKQYLEFWKKNDSNYNSK